MTNRTLVRVVFVIAAFVAIGTFWNSIYGTCLSMDICSHPRLGDVEVRMKPAWLPSTDLLDGKPLLTFERDGLGIRRGGEVVKFLIDPDAAKKLGQALTPKQFSWGRALVGGAGQASMTGSSQAPVYYLVVPEMGLIAFGTTAAAFDDIVLVARAIPSGTTTK